MDTKIELRRTLLACRNALSPEAVASHSHTLCTQLKILLAPSLSTIQSIASYCPIHHEIDPSLFVKKMHTQQKKIFFPRYNPIQACYELVEISDLEHGFVTGGFGILEPDPSLPSLSIAEASNAIDVWLVPGVAFSKTGQRLGMGKGIYDRFLASATGHKIGLAYPFQVLDNTLTQDPWDCLMTHVCTPEASYPAIAS